MASIHPPPTQPGRRRPVYRNDAERQEMALSWASPYPRPRGGQAGKERAGGARRRARRIRGVEPLPGLSGSRGVADRAMAEAEAKQRVRHLAALRVELLHLLELEQRLTVVALPIVGL